MRGRRGLTLLEVTVALAVLAIGVLAAQRLLGRSVATIAEDTRLTRAMLVAQTLLAQATLAPPDAGVVQGEAGGLPFVREVRPMPHPALREVRVRVGAGDRDPAAAELVELVRVPGR